MRTIRGKIMPSDIKNIEIEKTPIELYKLLKFENLASSGGEAKFAVARGQVRVNGRVETRKRKKLFAGDVVEFNGTRLRITTP